MKKQFTYSGAKTREINFPLGGIGSGSIGLTGSGRLCDFELYGRPNKKALPGLAFFAVKAEQNGTLLDARALCGDDAGTRTGFEESEYRDVHLGFGYGPASSTMAGVPHFPPTDFSVRFPYAQMCFSYEKFPGQIKMTAFNPFIPLNDPDSSIPAAFFSFEIENTTDAPIDYTVCGVLENPLPRSKNTFDGDQRSNMKCIRMYSANDEADNGSLDSPYNAKNFCLATDCEEISYQEYLYRGRWYDRLQRFWENFTETPNFKNRSYPQPQDGGHDACAIAAHITVLPGEKKVVRFVISWFVRYLFNYWLPIPKEEGESEAANLAKNRWKNNYLRYFSSSMECASYCLVHWDRLVRETDAFTDSLYASTLPDEILDAVSSNLCILKSSTILRHSDGNLISFEGSNAHSGSCEGNCNHVYNYAYALAHLFPKLERGLRETEYRICMNDIGAVTFRAPAPLGRRPGKTYFACVDGQMGGIIKTYREFKMTGDVEWLRGLWEDVKLSLEFTFNPENVYRWDPDASGVLTGRQHNTLDIELFGPSGWLQGMYAAALRAASEMAEIVGDKRAAEKYAGLFEKAKRYLNEELFYDGRYIQKIDLHDRSLIEGYAASNSDPDTQKIIDYYWDEESGEIKYQIGEGSAVDQTLAQWHADNVGLGEIYDPDKLHAALSTIYRLNFKKTMRDFFNPCRNFCVDDEGGVVICTYPEGAVKPKIPVVYAEECMNGFEYQAACQMIRHGLVDEGLEIVRALRRRYDGEFRNPFSEFECGNSYIRSLASYALLNSVCGMTYDMYREHLSFDPILRFSEDGYFKCFFAVGEAFGTVEAGPKYFEMKLLKGSFRLRSFGIFAEPKVVYSGGHKYDFKADGNVARFDVSILCDKDNSMMVIFD